MKENLKLFGTRILIEDLDSEKSNEMEKSKGGIYIPQTKSSFDRLRRATVIGVGDECQKVKPGNIIIYDKMGPAPFKVNDKTYEMIDESAVIGVYSETSDC